MNTVFVQRSTPYRREYTRDIPKHFDGGDIDDNGHWYGAEMSRGDAIDGVARTLLNRQNPAGYWSGHASGAVASSETADALVALNVTPIQLGVASTVTNVTASMSFRVMPSRPILARLATSVPVWPAYVPMRR